MIKKCFLYYYHHTNTCNNTFQVQKNKTAYYGGLDITRFDTKMSTLTTWSFSDYNIMY